MKLKAFILTLLVALSAIPAQAVLKEKDLGQTLKILRAELVHAHDDMGNQQKQVDERTDKLRKELIETMQRSNQNALMLYSQKTEYIFDLTYACHEATEQYRKFKATMRPFRQYVDDSNVEVARYDSLINSLSTMNVMLLDDQAKVDRNVCLTLSVNIRRMVIENAQTLSEYMRFYEYSERRLRTLNDYAQKRYNEIQNNIFVNGNTSYINILTHLPSYLEEARQIVSDKYSSMPQHSQWDSKIIFFLFVFIMVYMIVAIILNQLLLRIFLTRLVKKGYLNVIKDTFLAKRKYIIMASTMVTFAIILCVIRMTLNQNFILMASNLLIEFAWLMSVIMISVLIRVDGNEVAKTLRAYSPIMLVGFVVIVFRIVLIPSDLVSLILPPLLAACAVWQFIAVRRHRDNIQLTDKYYAYASLLVCIGSTISSWIGYTLLSVQLIIWWLMQLTCILTITCLKDWYDSYAERHDIHNRPITKTWFYYFFTRVITPSGAVISFLLSIYWAADVFNLTDTVWSIFTYHFIESDNFVASIISIAQVLILWFAFRYVNNTAKKFVRRQVEIHSEHNAESRSQMIISVMQVVIWGVWFLITLALLHVSNTWLVVISGGLSTGIGFASKDILENIYYGISLMMGRIKIGDYIVCDGIRGKVSSISYTSTMIEATDGSVIAFQNSQLFTKNYKNLTRNHGFEAQLLEVGVAYGTNIATVRDMLCKAVSQLDCVETSEHDVKVWLKDFADSCVTLRVVVWLDARTAAPDSSTVMECIYETLNKNGVEIPFPQHDVHFIDPLKIAKE